MNGVYWGLTALALMNRQDALPRDKMIEWVMSCYVPSVGESVSFLDSTRIRQRKKLIRRICDGPAPPGRRVLAVSEPRPKRPHHPQRRPDPRHARFSRHSRPRQNRQLYVGLLGAQSGHTERRVRTDRAKFVRRCAVAAGSGTRFVRRRRVGRALCPFHVLCGRDPLLARPTRRPRQRKGGPVHRQLSKL